MGAARDRQVNQELGEIGGVFVSKQPSDTDMGAKEPKTAGWVRDVSIFDFSKARWDEGEGYIHLSLTPADALLLSCAGPCF